MRRLLFLLGAAMLPLGAEPFTENIPEADVSDCGLCPPSEACDPSFLPCAREALQVDLVNPLYLNGVISTTEGGVLTGPGLRVQARNITYQTHEENASIYCEGDVLVNYHNWVITGDVIFFDFNTHSGYILNGRTASMPWFVGGRELRLCPDGTIDVRDAYVTTSEGKDQCDIGVLASHLTLSRNKIMRAKNIRFKVSQLPLLWFPQVGLNLKKRATSPFAVKVGWGGFLASHVSVLYNFLDWNDLRGIARVDGFFKHGLGGGIDTHYVPDHRETRFYTRNYFAHDLAILTAQSKNRYRFRGNYYDELFGKSLTLKGVYDFVSDPQMASDYKLVDFALPPAGKTQFTLRHQTSFYVGNLFAWLRVNNFESVNQELPSLNLQFKPYEIPYTGAIFESNFYAGYLDYVFSHNVVPNRDFNATRVATNPRIYRPTKLGAVTLTPRAGYLGVFYNNSPSSEDVGLSLGDFGLSGTSSFYRNFPTFRHQVDPYFDYTLLTSPSAGLPNHYIFTIDDGLDSLNQLRFGVRQSLFTKRESKIDRPLFLDIYTDAFFKTPTLVETLPYVYLDAEYYPKLPMKCGLKMAWDNIHQNIRYFKALLDWTLSENLALGAEYRARSKYAWRKADHANFILDSARTEQQLLNSILSDQRETFLLRGFIRPTPDATAKVELRHGWNRPGQPPYTEYLIDVGTVLYQHWRFHFIYELREADNRFTMSFKLDPGCFH